MTVADNSSIEPTTGITLEGWVRPNKFATGTANYLMSKASQYSLDISQGMPRFRAYANSTWYSVQASDADNAIFYEKFDGVLNEASNSFTPAFGYRALTPANLTSKLGVLITQSDNLQYSRGSQATADGTNVAYENFDPNQGTLEFWVKPNWNGNDGVVHYIYGIQYDGSNNVLLYKHANDRLYFMHNGSSHYSDFSISDWTAGTWYHVIGVWDSKNYVTGTSYLALYVNGTLLDSETTALASTSGVASSMFLGQTVSNTNRFNGAIAGRILNRPLSSTEVTALYNSGAGSTDSWVCDSDCVWMGNYSD